LIINNLKNKLHMQLHNDLIRKFLGIANAEVRKKIRLRIRNKLHRRVFRQVKFNMRNGLDNEKS